MNENTMIIVEVALFLVGGIFSVLWFLLRQKDAQQEKQIAELFRKHEEDAQSLNNLRIQIADAHYKKTDIDPKFEKIEKALTDGFKAMGDKLDSFIRDFHKGQS